MATFKINIKLKLLCFLLTIIILFISCYNKKHNEEKLINNLTIPELVKTAYELRDDDIFPRLCQLLNDSILESKYFWLQTVTTINEEVKTVDWMFLTESNYPPNVSPRLLFEVCINNTNKILVTNEFASINDIKKMAIEYKFNPNDIDRHITNEKIYIDYFGEVERSSVGFVLSLRLAEALCLSHTIQAGSA